MGRSHHFRFWPLLGVSDCEIVVLVSLDLGRAAACCAAVRPHQPQEYMLDPGAMPRRPFAYTDTERTMFLTETCWIIRSSNRKVEEEAFRNTFTPTFWTRIA
ncbi:hypothetical protein CC80DRAFT_497236 [Byssothecium circinans]|uniref:Secreted protein n=1 Tax=Byssothecium circinans TaxID=147558 RepID=A0A6A5TDP0_9PLEO|nr:hypothetical protein CC80DRAFT_497236 [Byssothecium circinans]